MSKELIHSNINYTRMALKRLVKGLLIVEDIAMNCSFAVDWAYVIK